MSVESRLKTAEQIAHARSLGADNRPCTCPDGQRRCYFIVAGATPAEVKEHIPYNRQYCPRCGGLNATVYMDKEDLGV